MNAHFCMGELAGISIGEKDHEACGYCGMEDAGCCHDLLQVVKLDGTQLEKASNVTADFKLIALKKVVNSSVIVKLWENNHKFSATTISLQGSLPIYLKNCVFRI